jgi:hypothetical protein
MRSDNQANIPQFIPGKAIGIIGIPDTVNEARVRTAVPSNLAVVKVEMRPENEGAILEFSNEAVRHISVEFLTGIRMQGRQG